MIEKKKEGILDIELGKFIFVSHYLNRYLGRFQESNMVIKARCSFQTIDSFNHHI